MTAGALEGWSAPTAGEIETRVRRILTRVAHLEGDYSPTADLFRELGVRSVVALDLLLSLEEEFGVTIEDAAFGEARSVGALVRLVQGIA